jgi:hypothetical protein
MNTGWGSKRDATTSVLLRDLIRQPASRLPRSQAMRNGLVLEFGRNEHTAD